MILSLTDIKEGSYIEYIGDSWAFDGEYTVHTAESTYGNVLDCPDAEKGSLLIIELMNDDTPMFFKVSELELEEWKLISL